MEKLDYFNNEERTWLLENFPKESIENTSRLWLEQYVYLYNASNYDLNYAHKRQIEIRGLW